MPLQPCVINLKTHTLSYSMDPPEPSLLNPPTPYHQQLKCSPTLKFSTASVQVQWKQSTMYTRSPVSNQNSISPRRCRFPHKGNLSQKNPKGQLPHMVPYQRQECQQNFPESEETQKRHMCNQCQGVRSTKKPNSTTYLNSTDIIELPPIKKRKDIYIIS